jgi:menaquinone-specific isochorismate synthase
MQVKHTQPHRVIAAARQIFDLSPLDFLHAAPVHTQRIHWERIGDALAFAGYGASAEIVAYGSERFMSIQQQAAALFAEACCDAPPAAMPRLFGGFAFREDFAAADGVWAAFPSAYFVLPRVQLTRVGGETWLTVSDYGQFERANVDALHAELDRLVEALEQRQTVRHNMHARSIRAAQIAYPLTHEAWRAQIADARQRIRAGKLQKVVLSRYCDLTFDAAVNPLAALESLADSYPQAYRFLIEVYPGHAFFGATPELLAEKRGASLATAALAGSRPRGKSAVEDHQLAGELMASPKERQEHQFVVAALQERLTPFARRLNIPEQPSIMRLRHIQHLYTPVHALLHEDADLLGIASALHPTPALGGTPQLEAISAIRRLETTDRGWYAAPVGWLDANGDGMFAAAIRSAVSVENQARLYAGAGIVADSDPDREWDETGLKFKTLLNALGVNGDTAQS